MTAKNEGGAVERIRVHGLGAIYWPKGRSENAMIDYWRLGRRYRESCGSPLEAVALRLLRKRHDEADRRGKVVGPSIERTRYADLEALLLADLEANRRPSYLASAKM